VPDVLQQHRAARARGLRVLVVNDWCAGGGGEFAHDGVPLIKAVGWCISSIDKNY
jgi:hypothetical protein